MMRHAETGCGAPITAERGANAERVRVVPVTLVAEPDAPLCACKHPRIRWSAPRSGARLRMYWMCASCLGAGFAALPRSENSHLPAADEMLDGIEAAANVLGDHSSTLALYVRHGEDLYARRSAAAVFDMASNNRILADVATELRERFQRAEDMRRNAEYQRQAEHATLVKRMRGTIARRKDAADRRLAKRPSPQASAQYAVVVEGAEVVKQLVYGLVDPLEPDRIRYVGKTTQGAHARYLSHVGDARRAAGKKRGGWIVSLLDAGRLPNMVLLETVPLGADLDARERWWITEMRRRDEADLNTTLPKTAQTGVSRAEFSSEFPSLVVRP